ncbi:MAG TPA: HEAT repeat domain-containing protein [Thermoanaerobaculia bacterium]|nr:HEAT repeat domain-containing protein [Thermoanaerobaculia bacterium]
MSFSLDLFAPFMGSRALAVIAVGVIVLTSLVLVLSAIMFTHHILSDRKRRRNGQRFQGAAVFLAPHIIANEAELLDYAQQARRRYGDRAVSLVLQRSRYDLKGETSLSVSHVLNKIGTVDRLLREVRSRREWKRAAAVRGLAECGGDRAIAVLLDAADKDETGDVRRSAREGLLLDSRPESVQAAIASFLKDLPRRAGWRRSFYARLASASSKELMQLINEKKLAGSEEKLALEALGDAGASEAIEFALSRLSSEDAELRATAVRLLGKLGTLDHIPQMLARLEDSEWFVRAAAARGLEWMASHTRDSMTRHHKECCRLLGAGLKDKSWWVRANAARGLAHQGQLGIDVLFRAGEADDNYARDAALAALALAQLSTEQQTRLRMILRRLEEIPEIDPVERVPFLDPLGGLA